MSDQAIQEYTDTSTAVLVLNPQMMESVYKMAELMAVGRSTVPKHLQGNQADCAAVVMQAVQWKMNPFVVAQKTHVSQSGILGYEAQLISAVATTSGALTSQPEFEFFGNWDRILGKVVEKQSDKGGKYYVAGWNKVDEEGLGVICSAHLRGEDEPRQIVVMLSQCYPRFSTQWATDPQQQISYAAVRKFCRRYAPSAILGVYSIDELQDEIDLNPRQQASANNAQSAGPGRAASVELEAYSDERFDQHLPAWRGMILSGRISAEGLLSKLQTKASFTDEQINSLMGIEQEQPADENA